MVMRSRLMCLFVLLLSMYSAKAQDVVASMKADTLSILVGQPLQVTLQLSQPRNADIPWPLFADSLGNLEIIQAGKVDTLKVDDPSVLLRSQTLTVSAYDSGTYLIPEMVFNYKRTGGEAALIYTDAIRIEVQTLPVDTTKAFKDIRPLEPAPFDPYWLMLGGFILLMLVVITALVVWYIRRRRRRKVVPVDAPVIIIPPHVEALQALEQLEKEKVWQDGRMKEYYTRLTDIVRAYIEKRWLVNALELTSDELLAHGFTLQLDQETRESLERLLKLADLVKFARMTPLGSDCESSMHLSRFFIERTAMVERKAIGNSEGEVQR